MRPHAAGAIGRKELSMKDILIDKKTNAKGIPTYLHTMLCVCVRVHVLRSHPSLEGGH